mgnify:FL=1
MTSDDLKLICLEAIAAAIAKTGPRRGALLAKCPPLGTDAAAAWQAIMFYADPSRCGLGHQVLFTERQEAIYREISTALISGDPLGLTANVSVH